MKKAIKIILIIVSSIAFIFGAFTALNKLNEGNINSYIDTFSAVEYESQLTPERDESGNAYFVTDRDFKVMHLTDIHIGGGILSAKTDKQVINAVAAMVTAEKPDLVIITGDISFAVPYAAGTINNSYAHSYFKRLMERLGVYWTVTFGNHDSEAYNFYNRAAVAKMYSDESMKYCLYSSADGISGEGNHLINVKNPDGFITRSFYMLDSHAYTDKDPLGIMWDYDFIKQDQIDWYKDNVAASNAHNQALYDALSESERAENDRYLTAKSLMFIHIPLREVKYAYDEYVAAGRADTDSVTYVRGYDGESDEVVYCSRSDENLFETMLELGSTEALFYGHDHLNNFVMEYKGITFAYGYSMDYLAYFGIAKEGFQRGCAVINCSPDATFEIIHENYYQDKYVPLYEKEEVNMERNEK
ncbi:MAG: metallophosphoesterase [Clostridia bacterium]|nr:metallophosphoesterase [Clostridia bacterium]